MVVARPTAGVECIEMLGHSGEIKTILSYIQTELHYTCPCPVGNAGVVGGGGWCGPGVALAEVIVEHVAEDEDCPTEGKAVPPSGSLPCHEMSVTPRPEAPPSSGGRRCWNLSLSLGPDMCKLGPAGVWGKIIQLNLLGACPLSLGDRGIQPPLDVNILSSPHGSPSTRSWFAAIGCGRGSW